MTRGKAITTLQQIATKFAPLATDFQTGKDTPHHQRGSITVADGERMRQSFHRAADAAKVTTAAIAALEQLGALDQ